MDNAPINPPPKVTGQTRLPMEDDNTPISLSSEVDIVPAKQSTRGVGLFFWAGALILLVVVIFSTSAPIEFQFKPLHPPVLGTTEEAQEAERLKKTQYLPVSPGYYKVPNQTSQVIVEHSGYYTIVRKINFDAPALWIDTWCASTNEILLDNLEQIKIEFVVNDTVVEQERILLTDYQRDEKFGSGYCRKFSILIKKWTSGEHKLVVHITIIQPVDDGWGHLVQPGMVSYYFPLSVPYFRLNK